MIIWVMKIFFVQFSVYSCNLFLISSASVTSIPFLSFIEPIFAWNVHLLSLIFLKSSLVFPILLFSSISLHGSLRMAFLSLLANLWNSAFKWVYLSFSPSLFTFFFSSAICKASSDSRYAFLHYFFLGMVNGYKITANGSSSMHSNCRNKGRANLAISCIRLYIMSVFSTLFSQYIQYSRRSVNIWRVNKYSKEHWEFIFTPFTYISTYGKQTKEIYIYICMYLYS